MNGAAVARVPAPAAGSARSFALLYSAHAQRALLALLMALADEIGAGAHRQLDHALAHARLEWWRSEAQRFAAGSPEHPWLIKHRRRGGDTFELTLLVEAAAIDLATARLGGRRSWHLSGALLRLAARALADVILSAPQEQCLDELGQWLGALEEPFEGLPPTQPGPRPAMIEPTLQPMLAPLSVWLAVAACQRQRRRRHRARTAVQPQPSRLEGCADNLVAWRAARRALRGCFDLERIAL